MDLFVWIVENTFIIAPVKLNKMRIRKEAPNSTILVLNSDYLPINVTTFKKAYKLIYKEKAEIIVEGEYTINTDKLKFNSPTVIRLKKQVNVPYRKVILSRENLFKRDNFQCGYCGSNKNLTIDHIHPKSKGGTNDWKNLVTCCKVCNSYKGDKTLEQVHMTLMIKPFKPQPLYFLCQSHKHNKGWEQFLIF